MKVLVPAVAVLLLAGCTNTINTHQKDFSPSTKKGPWTDYYAAIQSGEKPQPPKEKK
jgi:outer membrane biogenesis lipoprotein LolB